MRGLALRNDVQGALYGADLDASRPIGCDRVAGPQSHGGGRPQGGGARCGVMMCWGSGTIRQREEGKA